MKYWYDTEFIDDGYTIELLSIGIVAEDGREYYAVVKDIYTMRRAWDMKSGNEFWLRKNVMNSLPFLPSGNWDENHFDYTNLKTRAEIAREVEDFFLDIEHRDRTQMLPHVELWAWFAAYDHVALSQLFGRMLDLPEGIPMYTNDIKQEHHRLGFPRVPQQAQGAHNALEDARWNKTAYEYLASLDGPIARSEDGTLLYMQTGFDGSVYAQAVPTANPKRTRVW